MQKVNPMVILGGDQDNIQVYIQVWCGKANENVNVNLILKLKASLIWCYCMNDDI